MFYCEDTQTRKQESLKTKNEAEANTLLHSRNEAFRQPILNRQIALAYLSATDGDAAKRSWQFVMHEITATKTADTHKRYVTAMIDPAFDLIRDLPLLETRAEHFLKVLRAGTVSTNVYLRRLHNFALDMSWLLKSVIPRLQWPKPVFKSKRAITATEHAAIVGRELNAERRDFYELLWHTGASQTDAACLMAEDIDWNSGTICYSRRKLKSRGTAVKPALIRFGAEVEAILKRRPQAGALFPHLCTVRAGDRATEIKQRCDGLEIKGVSLHSYRYAWAERALKCGYPERFAQQALGHNSKAIHAAYSRNAEVTVPSLDDWEKQWKENPHKLIKPAVVQVDFQASQPASAPPSDEAGAVAQGT